LNISNYMKYYFTMIEINVVVFQDDVYKNGNIL
jgi:hypothetical protein